MVTVPFRDDVPQPKPSTAPEPAPIPESNPAVTTWREVSQRLDAEDAAAEQRRRTVVARAGLDIAPERAARAIAMSRRTGLRASLLAEPGVLEDAEQQAKGGTFDFEAFRTTSPSFAAWAEQDPANAALTADDHRELARMEALTRETGTMRARPDGGFETLDEDGRITGFYRDPYAFRAAQRDARTAQENADELGTGMRERYGEGIGYQFATGALGSAGSTLGLLGAIDRDTAGIVGGISAAAAEWDSTLVAEVTRGAGGLSADAPLILLGGPLASAAKGLGTIARAGALATRVVGARAAGIAGKAALTAAAVQPLALREAGDAYAGGASLGDAATSWAIETFIPAAFGQTGVERMVTRGLSERAGKALYTSARTLLTDAGLEATEEVTTELAHAIHEVMSGQNPDALELAPLARRLTVAGILGGGAGATFNLPRFIADNRRKDPATRMMAAFEHGNRLEALGAAASASKTTGRAPEEVERVLNQASQGAEGYLDPEAWTGYWRAQQQDPRAMAQQILGDARVYDEAARTGGQLRVPLGTFAARLPEAARTHFADEIRSEPDAQNRREAKVAGDALLAEEVNDPAAVVERSQLEQRDAIAASIEQQLTGAGTAPEVAAEQAAQMARVFAVTAQRAGITPEQLFARYDLRINLVLPDILTARDGVPDPVLDTLRRGTPGTGDSATAVDELRSFVTRHGIDLTADNVTVRRAISQARQRDQQAALRERWQAEDDKTAPLDKARQVGADAAQAQQRALAEGPDGQAVIDAALARLEAARTPGGMGLGDLMRTLGPDYGFQVDGGVKTNATQQSRATLFRNALRARGLTLASLADAEGLLRAEEAQAVAVAGETWSPEQEQAVADAYRLRDLAPAFTASRLTTEQEAEAIALAALVGETLDALPLAAEAKAEIAAAVGDVRGVVLGQTVLEQRKDTRRGQIALGRKNAAGVRPMAIDMFQRADLSTFFHEGGHLYLELLGDLAEDAATPQGIKDDYARVLAWLGVTDRRQIKTEQHEKWARGFEAYLMEGKAPAVEIRGAFNRFKLWLTDLYKTVRNLNVELTDEARGVFDRLLATDEEITDAVEQLNARPLFADAAQAGMTAAEFLAYRERSDEAIASARTELEAQTLAEVNRERTAWWKEKRTAMALEVELEVNRQPDQIAASVLARGRYPGNVPLEPEKSPAPKLSALAVQAWLDAKGYEGEGRRTANRKLQGMSAKGETGINPDAAAELFGYPSGDALLQALVGRRNREELIDALTTARMQAAHGNMMLDGSMAETARELVNGTLRGELLVTEVKALGKKVGAKAAPSELLRQQAIARIGRMPIKDLRPDVFRRAQAQAARRAFEAIARGDNTAALIEKQKELLNYHLTRAAQEAREGVEQDRAFLRKLQEPKKRQDIGKAGGWEWTLYRADGSSESFASDEAASQAKAAAPGSWYEQTSGYLLQIDAILERYDLATGSNRGTGQRMSLRAWIAEQEKAGAAVNLPDAVIDQADRKAWRELTVDELGAVRDAVAHIAHLAKKKNTLQAAHDKRAYEQVRDDAIRTMQANVAKRAPEPRIRSGVDTAFAWLDSATAAHRKVSSLMRQADGDADGGVWWNLFVRPLNEAADREVILRREAADQQKQLWDAWRKAGRDLSERATVTGADAKGKSWSETLTINERIAVALQWGNEGNRERLLDGEGWTQAQALAVLDTLTEADWTLVQGIWNHIDSYWSDIKAKQERVEGVAPEKVPAVPVSTKYGQLKGGYYPVIYDPKRSAKAGNQEAATAANLYAIGQASRATTRRGHTKARSEGTGKPLLLDVSGISRHLSQVIHDLSHHETIIDLNKLLRDDQVSQTIADHLGAGALKQISGTVADVAVSDLNDTGIDTTLRYVRNGVSVAAMGFNVGTMMMQVTGVGQSMQRVGALNFARGVFRLFSDPARQESARAFIMGKSAFMRDRATTQTREVADVLNQVQGTAWRQNLNRLAFMGMQQAQMLVDMPTWYAGYESALDAGRTEADAVAMADQAVIDAQGSGLTKDLSGVQRSRVGSMFTVFYSYFSTTYNRTAEALATAGRQRRAGNTGAAIAKLAMDMVQIYTVPAMLAVAVRAAMDKDDEKDTWLTKLGKEHLSLAGGTMVGLREVAPALTSNYGYSGPGGSMGFGALYKLIQQAKQGEVDAALIKAAAQTAGILGHLPTLQAQRLVEGVLHYLDDRDASAKAIIFGPPPRSR
jgi:hypothetical protein